VKEYTNRLLKQNIPETDPHIQSQLIFDKGAKATEWRKVLTINGTTTRHPHVKKNLI
jgi:hypothetical protein